MTLECRHDPLARGGQRVPRSLKVRPGRRGPGPHVHQPGVSTAGRQVSGSSCRTLPATTRPPAPSRVIFRNNLIATLRPSGLLRSGRFGRARPARRARPLGPAPPAVAWSPALPGPHGQTGPRAHAAGDPARLPSPHGQTGHARAARASGRRAGTKLCGRQRAQPFRVGSARVGARASLQPVSVRSQKPSTSNAGSTERTARSATPASTTSCSTVFGVSASAS